MTRRFSAGLLVLAFACLGCGEAEKANWTTTSSGLKYEDLDEGDGPAAKKGDLVEVQGRLHYSKWTDRDGVERYAVEIVAEEVLFL